MANHRGAVVVIATTDGGGRNLRVAHVITGLGRGGAEAMLLKLLAALPAASGFDHSVVSLTAVPADAIPGQEVDHTSLGLQRGSLNPLAVLRLREVLGAKNPDVIQGWMYHGNVAARLAAPRGVPIIFNIHHTLNRLADEKASLRAVIRLGALLARGPVARVLYCSEAGQRQHEAIGYPAARSAFIPNGFDCERFQPVSEAKRAAIREHDLDLPADAFLIIHIGRHHPVKNHAGLIASFAALVQRHPRAHLLLLGSGVTPDQPSLARSVASHGVGQRVHLLGERDDVHRLLPACDLMVLASFSEAFPNVLGEAMACGVPCVTTDVGDAATMVGATGRVVAPGESAALTDAMAAVMELPSHHLDQLKRAARARVVAEYSLPAIAARFAHLYRDVFSGSRPQATPPRGERKAGR